MPRPSLFHADLHIHSKYSRACSRDCDLEHLTWYAKRKGLTLVGTGDFTHPAWNAHLHDTLVEAEPGLYRLNDDLARSVDRTLPGIVAASTVRFMLSVEISTIYKRDDKTRKVHHLVYLPDLEAVDRFNTTLARIGNIASDGRPILGLDSRDLLEITLESSPDGYLVPAHIWTPWFAALGSKSGFDAIADCYADLADNIFAVETGLSSDPSMNWRVSSLDKYTLVSNSDAHSPPALAREAHSYETALDYFAVRDALKTGDGYAGSIEFFPEEGKYHADGHRACNLSWQPAETIAAGGTCEVCGKPVTVGVLSRVEALADRPEGERPPGKAAFRNLVPLPEIVGEIHSVGPRSKTVTREVDGLVAALGPELDILTEVPVDQVAAVGGEVLGEAIGRLRRGEVIRQPGYDGEYGVIRLFEPAELKASSGASALFDLPEQDDYAVRRTTAGRSLAGNADGRGTAGSGRAAAVAAGPAFPAMSASSVAAQAGTAARGSAEGPGSAGPGSAARGSGAARGGAAGRGRGNSAVGRAADPAALLETAGIPAPRGVDTAPDGNTARGETPARGGTPARGAQDPAGLATHGGASYGGPPPSGPDEPAAAGPAGVEIELPLQIPDRGVLEGLDPEQRAAAGAADGPLLVVAGPGTGKTRTLTHRVAYLVAERGVAAESCLAITFTRRAAGELTSRLASLLPSGEPFVATFHALALAICREQFAALGFAEPPSVADDADRDAVLAELDLPAGSAVPDALAEGYRKRLRARGLLELDELVRSATPFAAGYRSRWPYVLVDEYQDVDAEQYALLRELVPSDGNLFAIGDPDQSIYSFRGADVGFFLRFSADFPSATVVTLTRNYRSAPPIVAAAVQVVRPGTLVPGRGLSAERRDLGAARLVVHSVASEAEEAGWVAATVDALVGGASFHSLDSGRADGVVEEHYDFSDVAVLYRTDAQSRALQSAFTSAGLPFQKRGIDRLSSRPGVSSVLREMALLPGSVAQRLRAAGAVLAARSAAPDLFSAEDVGLRESDVWAAVELLRPSASEFGEDLDGFLSFVSLGAEVDALDARADAVSMLTLHAAKGLEYPVVFLVGAVDGVLPMRFGGASDPEQEAEERRLFFVGVTRAQRRLFVSAPRELGRRGQTKLTPFLEPVDEGLLDRTGAWEAPRRPAARQMRLI
ncbi:UvrD-helicase domain-containing protein [Cryptosporangium phraense]|uniref:AAA family ATPase n=1 Tax=Cryptosporangium phraense TaxID=2593070 RepID=A0A545AMC4_9ACTN|nr:UvrD-helicase domain-containing protein [Cryptosporangium phraense]TQS42456.1 AAA family ATPase [Cryptosporangium phraense]